MLKLSVSPRAEPFPSAKGQHMYPRWTCLLVHISALSRLIFAVVLPQLAYCWRAKVGFEILTGVPSTLCVCRPTGWPPAVAAT